MITVDYKYRSNFMEIYFNFSWVQRSSKRSTIEKDRGEVVKSRYSRSSTGSNIIKAGTIVDPRTVVRDGEDRSIA